MRRLILMRHSKAERGSPTGEDFDRPLNAAGLEDAKLMGRVLTKEGLAPDRALISSAVRTRQTWEALSSDFASTPARFTRDLYLADPDELLDAIEAEEDCDTLLVLAHNPGVHAMALRLLTESAAPPSVMARMNRGFPTSTLAVFDIDAAGRGCYGGLYLAQDFGGGGGE